MSRMVSEDACRASLIRARSGLLAILCVSAALSIFSILRVPFSTPIKDYLDAAEVLSQGRRIGQFMPIAYSLFLAAALKAGGHTAIFISQAGLYLATVFLSFCLLKELKADVIWTMAGALLVACHPYLVVNIKRIVENNLAVPFLVLFVLILHRLKSGKICYGSAVFFGVCLGLMLLIRANFLMVLPLYWLTLLKDSPFSFRKKIGLSLLTCAVFIGTLYTVTVGVTGHFFILPGEGGYNFFAGANPFTAEHILGEYHSEFSMAPALKFYGIEKPSDEIYRQLALRFVTEHPLEYVRLVFLRFFALIRPDYRLLGISETVSSPQLLVVAQTFLAAPFYFWLIVKTLTFRNVPKAEDSRIFLINALYAVPFLLIMADPRYRLPMDVLFLLDSVYLISKSVGRKVQ